MSGLPHELWQRPGLASAHIINLLQSMLVPFSNTDEPHTGRRLFDAGLRYLNFIRGMVKCVFEVYCSCLIVFCFCRILFFILIGSYGI